MAGDTVRAALAARIAESPIRMKEVATLLDGLSHDERVTWVRATGRREQRRLWQAAAGFLPLSLQDVVPPARADGETVRHFGRNTLPAFTGFEKRFARPAGEDPRTPGRLYGFNFQSLAWLTGPGYFVARADPALPEILIDYREIPPEAPAGWPPLRRNEVGLGRFVYGNMVDRLRRVSEHVTIGSAARGGRDLGSWFLLTREG
jgi:hypothetical protein